MTPTDQLHTAMQDLERTALRVKAERDEMRAILRGFLEHWYDLDAERPEVRALLTRAREAVGS